MLFLHSPILQEISEMVVIKSDGFDPQGLATLCGFMLTRVLEGRPHVAEDSRYDHYQQRPKVKIDSHSTFTSCAGVQPPGSVAVLDFVLERG